jgi:hypothetical protein
LGRSIEARLSEDEINLKRVGRRRMPGLKAFEISFESVPGLGEKGHPILAGSLSFFAAPPV